MSLALIRKKNARIVAACEVGAPLSAGGRSLIASAVAGWEDSEYVLVACTVTDPPFDPDTQVREGPVDVVTPKTWTPCSRTFTVRAMTQEELADRELSSRLDTMQRKLLTALTALYNEVRALKGQQPWTEDQVMTWIRGL